MKKEKEVRKEEDIEKMSKEELDKISGGAEGDKSFTLPTSRTPENGGQGGQDSAIIRYDGEFHW